MSSEKVKPSIEDVIHDIRLNSVTVLIDADTDIDALPRPDGEEAVALCPECEAVVWIAEPAEDGQLYLMRICEVEREDCRTCTRAHQAVSDPDIEAAIRGVLEDD